MNSIPYIFVVDRFEYVVASIKSMRKSNVRSIRMAVAVFCAKMPLGLSNKVVGTMFHIQDERTVSHVVH